MRKRAVYQRSRWCLHLSGSATKHELLVSRWYVLLLFNGGLDVGNGERVSDLNGDSRSSECLDVDVEQLSRVHALQGDWDVGQVKEVVDGELREVRPLFGRDDFHS